MKKKNRWLLTLIPLLICAVVTGVYAFVFVLNDDTTAPILSVDTEVLEVSVNATEEELLQGVTAMDDEDGDVTDAILVEGISNLMDNDTAIVTYAAFDDVGNVSKATRTIRYKNYQPPVFGQKKALVFQSNTSPDILTFMSANDKVDGDISNRIKGTLISDTNNLNNTGVHEVEFRVTNSLGDTEYLTLPVEVYAAGTYNANVELNDYLVYIKRGSVFHPEDYLEKLVVGYNEYSLKNQNPPIENLTIEQVRELPEDRDREIRTYINNYVDPNENVDPLIDIINVEIKNEVKNTIPGIYSVTFTVNYEDRYVGYTRLNVVVEE